MNLALAKRLLAAPSIADDKYSRGSVGFATGSERYPGAAILGVTAAFRAGIGLVRYFGPTEVGKLVLLARPETVLGDGQVDCWVIGSGIDMETDGQTLRDSIAQLRSRQIFNVIDAGGLDLIGPGEPATNPDSISAIGPMSVLTPHHREAARLLTRMGHPASASEIAAEPTYYARMLATATKSVVVLKGHTTVVAGPFGEPESLSSGPTELATAGTGDVLAGILGALIAKAVRLGLLSLANQNAEPTSVELSRICALGVEIHSASANKALQKGPFAALDVAEAVREVMLELSLQNEARGGQDD